MDKIINHSEQVALRKLGDLPKGFEFCRWEVIGPDAVCWSGGIARIIKRGPRKGDKAWDKITHRAVVTDAEELAEIARYESATGKCAKCCGAGQEFFGWSAKTGHRFRTCHKCDGTGKAQPKGES